MLFHEEKTKFASEINSDILEKTRIVCKAKKIKLNAAIEFGLKGFLEAIKLDLSDLANLSLSLDKNKMQIDCSIEIEINNEIFISYEAFISHGRIILYTDKGNLNYSIKSINGFTTIEMRGENDAWNKYSQHGKIHWRIINKN